ncbi:MAG: hypothetical protein HW421_1469 [Ignavibacteria bacterium]|nr:hypothetical protein [Ignavibacteria bacterium]
MKKIVNKSLMFCIALFFVQLVTVLPVKSQLVGTVIALTGSVFNIVTRDPVTVYLLVLDSTMKKVNQTRSNAAENGLYYVTGLKPGNKYYIDIRQKNFLQERVEINVPLSDKYQEVSRDFLVKPREKDAKIKITVPPFELNKAKIRYGTEDMLMDYVNMMTSNPTLKIQIQCYPDNEDNKALNEKFTLERAKALSDFMTGKGIQTSRLAITGSATLDPDPKNQPPKKKAAKGKRYIGTTYFVISEI